MSDLILISIKIYGMAIVISFMVAVLIKGIVVALPVMRRRSAPQARSPAMPAAVVPPHHVAAIAAAVAAVMGPSHIIHIEDRGRTATWAAEGRMMHQTSHAVTRTHKP